MEPARIGWEPNLCMSVGVWVWVWVCVDASVCMLFACVWMSVDVFACLSIKFVSVWCVYGMFMECEWCVWVC